MTHLLHQVLDLIGSAAGGGVGDGPGGLLPGAEVGPPQDLNQHREYVGVNHLLMVGKAGTGLEDGPSLSRDTIWENDQNISIICVPKF